MYSKIQETIAGNITFLTTQIQPYMDKYNCRNAFELFTHKFEDPEEKVRVMGYVHRRDAFVYMGNQIAYEQMSVAQEAVKAVGGVLPAVRKNEIIINAFQREVEKQMQRAWIQDSKFVDGVVEFEVDSREKMETLIEFKHFNQAIPYLAVLWYNAKVEPLLPKPKKVVEGRVKVEPGPDDEPPLLA